MNKPTLSYVKNHGAALITALLLVAFVVMTVTLLVDNQRISIKKTEQVLNSSNAYYYALGVEDWAMGYFRINQKDLEGQEEEGWPKVLPKTPIPGGEIEGRIYDLQKKYNINNVVRSANRKHFVQLLQVLDAELSKGEATELAMAVYQWVKTGSTRGESKLFSQDTVQHRKAHQEMTSMSELLLVEGIDKALYEKLSPHVMAVPGSTIRINVNTASEAVLMSISDKMQPEDASILIDFRNQSNGFETVQQFVKHAQIESYKIPSHTLTVESNYFLVEADVIMGSQFFRQYSLLKVIPRKGKVKITVLWRSQGAL